MVSSGDTQRVAVVPCMFCGSPNRIDLTRTADGPKCGSCGRPFRLDRPQRIGDDTFDKVIRGTGVPILVDCYADWCGPCKIVAPTVDEFALRHAGAVLVTKLDTDANPATASRLGIRGIPTLLVFRDGSERGRHVGVADTRTLEALVGS